MIVPTVAVAELATAPRSPSNSSLLLHLLLGLGLFGALGAAFVTYREVTRDLFDMPADVMAATGLPVLGTVPNVTLGRMSREEMRQASALREAYRYLRTKLRANPLSVHGSGQAADAGQVLLVAGLSRRAGTSLTARRIALDLAALNKRVLLIDADIKRGTQHRALQLSNELGLSDLLNWEAGTDISSCFSKVEDSSLTVLTSGATGMGHGDLLASERMERTLALLRKSFDTIVVDTAPVLARADAAALSTYADGTLLVMRSDRTTRSETHARAAASERGGSERHRIPVHALRAARVPSCRCAGHARSLRGTTRSDPANPARCRADGRNGEPRS